MLQELSQPQKRVKACDIDQLKQAVQAGPYWLRSNCQTCQRLNEVFRTVHCPRCLELSSKFFKFQFWTWQIWQAHAALKWDERLAKLSGEEGIVVQQDKAGHPDWRPSVGVPIRSDGSSPTAGLVSFKVIGLGRHTMTYVHFLHLHFLHFISCSKKWCAFEENATCFRHF